MLRAVLVVALALGAADATRPLVGAPAPAPSSPTVLDLCDCAFEAYGGCVLGDSTLVPRGTRVNFTPPARPRSAPGLPSPRGDPRERAPSPPSPLRTPLTPPRPRLLAPRTPNRRALNEAHDATACKKQGFFVAGFETPGQYVALHDEYIPLSRAICCRPCVRNDDRVSVAALAAIAGAEKENFTADDVVAVSAECRGSTRGAPGAGPAARSASGVAADGPSCPADTFVQGFAEDVRANPGGGSGDQYYYPTGGARCCAPRVLLRAFHGHDAYASPRACLLSKGASGVPTCSSVTQLWRFMFAACAS